MSRPVAAAPIVYYRDKGFLITSIKAKSPHKTYRIDKIEKIALRRDPFFIMLALTTLHALFILKFGFYFSFDTIFTMLVILLTLTYCLARVGLLFVTSKAVSELAFIGLYDRLTQVHEAIEESMHREDHDDGLAAGHDEDDDDE